MNTARNQALWADTFHFNRDGDILPETASESEAVYIAREEPIGGYSPVRIYKRNEEGNWVEFGPPVNSNGQSVRLAKALTPSFGISSILSKDSGGAIFEKIGKYTAENYWRRTYPYS